MAKPRFKRSSTALLKAADLLEAEDWVQGEWEEKAPCGKVSRCAEGAVAAVTGDLGEWDCQDASKWVPRFKNPKTDKTRRMGRLVEFTRCTRDPVPPKDQSKMYRNALRGLLRGVKVVDPNWTSDSVAGWNDEPGRTKDEVITAMRVGAALLRAKGQ